MRAVALFSAFTCLAALGACATFHGAERTLPPQQQGGYRTLLADDVYLTFSAHPGYPVEETLIQTVVGQYADRRTVFQAVLDLSPDNVSVVVTAASGPRILTISWSDEGISETRTMLAPDALTSLNILGDIVLTLWPAEEVQAMLPDNAQLVQSAGVRTISADGKRILTTSEVPSSASQRRHEFHNLAFNYRLSIITDSDQ